jgi:hypothetical protein
MPGSDPEFEAIVQEHLRPWLSEPPPPEAMRGLTELVYAHVGMENKRQNLLGEGFEDSLAELLRHMPSITKIFDVRVRSWLHDLPGFHLPRGMEKPKQVDLTLVAPGSGKRVLVSCKWSIRSDREEQFSTDFHAYSRLEASGQDFDYVLVTNEFDPARLSAACETRIGNQLMFTRVVHVNRDGPLTAYGVPQSSRRTVRERGADRAREHAERGRLLSLRDWLEELASAARSGTML